MNLEENKLFYDILICISSIDDHLEHRKIFEDYLKNKTKRRAVERELEIIGEAVNKLTKLNPSIKISFSRQIVDLRNKVIHSYDNVNDMIIWNVIINHLPTLKTEIDILIGEKK